MLQPGLVIGVSLLYILTLFLIASWADKRQVAKRSVIANPHIYSLSIAVYATSWTYYGSVGKAATTGLDYLLIYLGPSLTAFSWWFVLRKTVRICKENNITSIADFISSRYGKSQRLGGLVTLIAILGIMPYIALQLKAVSTSFEILCAQTHVSIPLPGRPDIPVSTSALAAVVLALFAVLFGAKRLSSTERHEGLVAAIALESVVKLCAFVAVGIFVTFFLFNGFDDIFSRMAAAKPELLDHLTTFGGPGEVSYATIFSMLAISMGAIMLLPRQFHIMVIENADERHIREAMWLFPAYLFLINLFVMPIALAGILVTGSGNGADFFVLSLPLKEGHHWLALLAFLGGFSAAAGMVMVESIAISTMLLDHLLMPILVRIAPNGWFPGLLLNLKRCGILLVVFLGYLYHNIVADKYMLVNMGIISFVAAAQFAPAFIGGLYWRRGNKAGALVGMSLGFILWLYTLLLPSLIQSGWWQTGLLEHGLFGISLLRPTALFGLDDFDLNTHAVFWSLLFNIGGYLAFSILMPKEEREREPAEKFVTVFKPREEESWERKRLSKPVTIMQFVNLMAKFVGEEEANSRHRHLSGEPGDRRERPGLRVRTPEPQTVHRKDPGRSGGGRGGRGHRGELPLRYRFPDGVVLRCLPDGPGLPGGEPRIALRQVARLGNHEPHPRSPDHHRRSPGAHPPGVRLQPGGGEARHRRGGAEGQRVPGCGYPEDHPDRLAGRDRYLHRRSLPLQQDPVRERREPCHQAGQPRHHGDGGGPLLRPYPHRPPR